MMRIVPQSLRSLPRSLAALSGLLLAAALGGACQEESSPSPTGDARPAVPAPSEPTPPPKGSKYLQAASVRISQTVVVREAPDTAAERIGTMVKETRVKALEYQDGPGCSEGWVRIAEKDWVCAKFLQPDEREVAGLEIPPVEGDRIVPGEYGDVIANGANLYANLKAITKGVAARQVFGHTVIRKEEEIEVQGKKYWRTASGEYILASAVKPYTPSAFHGVRLENDLTLPLVFIMPGKDPKKPGVKSPNVIETGGGRGYAKVLESVPLGRARKGVKQSFKHRIGENEWVSGWLVRFARPVEQIPADIKPDERWIDIDLDEQVLVAYEGPKPVYATLVSTGRLDPTPRGIFRIYQKHGETSMASEMGDDRPYLVEKVPWTQFFQAGIALHCAYWHNGFGYPRSRGCVNLAPIDARFLYQWTDPQPPPGWATAHGNPDRPGTLVRVHSAEDDQLYYYGYARDVAKARGVKVRGAPSLKEQMEATKDATLKRIADARAKEAELAAKKAAAEGTAPAAPAADAASSPADARTPASAPATGGGTPSPTPAIEAQVPPAPPKLTPTQSSPAGAAPMRSAPSGTVSGATASTP